MTRVAERTEAMNENRVENKALAELFEWEQSDDTRKQAKLMVEEVPRLMEDYLYKNCKGNHKKKFLDL